MASKKAIKNASRRQARKLKIYRERAQEAGFQLRPTWMRKSYSEALQEFSKANERFNLETVLDEVIRFWLENSLEGKSFLPTVNIGKSFDIECFFRLAEFQFIEEVEKEAKSKREQEIEHLKNYSGYGQFS